MDVILTYPVQSSVWLDSDRGMTCGLVGCLWETNSRVSGIHQERRFDAPRK